MAGLTRNERQVPAGWQVVRLGDVAEIRKGLSFTRKGLVPGNVPVIAGGREPAYFNNIANRPGETITVSASGAHAGFVAFHLKPIFATDCTTVRAQSAVSKTAFIYHVLKHSENVIYGLRSGSAQPHVYPRDIASCKILLPSLPEQRAIAAVLDSIDEAIEHTDTVIAATERLRDALLHELLTRGVPGWHSEWKDVHGMGTIPADWEVVRLGDVAEVQTGRAVNRKAARNGNLQVPYLSVANVKDGYVDLSVVKTMVVSEGEVGRYRLQAGDVLLTEGGDADKLGRGTVWRGQITPCLHQNHIFAVRPCKGVLHANFLASFAGSARGKRYFLGAAKQTTNLASINSSQVKQMPIPIPDIREQTCVVDILSALDGYENRAQQLNVNLQQLKTSTAAALLTGQVRLSPETLTEYG